MYTIKFILCALCFLSVSQIHAQNNFSLKGVVFDFTDPKHDYLSYNYNVSGKNLLTNDTIKVTTYTRRGLMVKNTGIIDAKFFLNTKDKTLYIKERDLNINFADCYFTLHLKYEIVNGNTECSGTIYGLTSLADTCFKGLAYLVYPANIEENAGINAHYVEQALISTVPLIKENKAELFIVTPEQDIEINASKALDYSTQSDSVFLNLIDYDVADDDVITLYVNDEIKIYYYRLVNESKVLSIPLAKNEKTVVKIKVVSEGLYPPCSAQIEISTRNDEARKYTLAGKRGEEIFIYLMQQ
jgi:hypothetical protein